MFCGNCGTRNPDLNKYCRECGTRLPDPPSRTLSEDPFAASHAPQPAEPADQAKVAALMDVAFSYHREGKLDQAIETCREAIALNNESTSAHSLLALLFEEKGQFDEAMAHQQRVLELNPDSVADRENLARLLGESPASDAAGPVVGSGITAFFANLPNRPLLAGLAASVLTLTLILTLAARVLYTPSPQETAASNRNMGIVPPGNGAPAAPYANTATATPNPQPATTNPQQAAPLTPPAGSQVTEPAAPASRRADSPAPRVESIAPANAEAGQEEQIEPLPSPENPQMPAAPRMVFVPSRQTPAAAPAPTAWPRPQSPALEPSFTPSRAALAPTPASSGSGSRIVVKVSEATPRHYEKWGIDSAAEGKYDEALSQLRKALDGARSAGDRGRIHQQMAYSHQQLGQNAAAADEYRSAITQYQEQLNQGANTDQARAGIRASEAGLRNLGM